MATAIWKGPIADDFDLDSIQVGQQMDVPLAIPKGHGIAIVKLTVHEVSKELFSGRDASIMLVNFTGDDNLGAAAVAYMSHTLIALVDKVERTLTILTHKLRFDLEGCVANLLHTFLFFRRLVQIALENDGSGEGIFKTLSFDTFHS